MKGALPWLVRWACRAGTGYFCPVYAALVGPAQNSLFLTVHYFNSFVPIARSKLGSWPCCVTCLLVCVSDSNTCLGLSGIDKRAPS